MEFLTENNEGAVRFTGHQAENILNCAYVEMSHPLQHAPFRTYTFYFTANK